MSKINITSVNINKYPNEQSKILGVATIVINECFIVKDIRIIKTDNKIFCAMPNRKLINGEFRDICNPIDQKTRIYIEKTILSKFNEV